MVLLGAGLFGLWAVLAVGLFAYARSDSAFQRWVMERGGPFGAGSEAAGEEGFAAVESRLQALHKGRLPCLRHSYAYRATEEEVSGVGRELLALGLEPQVLAELVGQFLLWSDERENAAHEQTAARELAQVLGDGQPITAFVLWVQLDRLEEALTVSANEHHAQGQRVFAALSTSQQRALRTLWEQNPQHFAIGSLVPLLDSMRTELTRTRLTALSRAVRDRFDRGELDEVKLEALAREAGVPAEDGWGNALSVHDEDGRKVVLRSHAFVGDAEELSREVLRPGAKAEGQSSETAAPSGCDGAPAPVELARAEFDAALEDMDGLSRSARVVPAIDVVQGFKLFAIRPHSLLARAGFCNGDLVSRVNGYDLHSPERALQAYSAIRAASDVRVELVRRGHPHVLLVRVR